MPNQLTASQPEFSENDLVIVIKDFFVKDYLFLVQKNSVCSVVCVFDKTNNEGYSYAVAYELTQDDYQRYPNFEDNFILFVIPQNCVG